MICRLLLLFTLSFHLSKVFGFTPCPVVPTRPPAKAATGRSLLILTGWLDFKPFQGSGSAKEELDEQWEAQQEILRARRSEGIDKEHLKKKYAAKKTVPVEADIEEADVVNVVEKSPSEVPPARFKLPWEK
jgi:hypothetical protein